MFFWRLRIQAAMNCRFCTKQGSGSGLMTGPFLKRVRWTSYLAIGGVVDFGTHRGIGSGSGRGAAAGTQVLDPEVRGYKLHYGRASGYYDQFIDVGNTTTAVASGLAAGQTFYFVVTAYDSAGVESLPSNEVSLTQPTPQPASLNVQVLDPAYPDFPVGVVAPIGGNETDPAVLIGLTRWSVETGFEFIAKGPKGGHGQHPAIE